MKKHDGIPSEESNSGTSPELFQTEKAPTPDVESTETAGAASAVEKMPEAPDGERPVADNSQTGTATATAKNMDQSAGVSSEQTSATEEIMKAIDGEQKSPLSAKEQADLTHLVARFCKLQGLWYESLQILAQIKARRLYRQDHPDFETFCRKVFGMGKSNVNRCLQSAEIGERVATIVAKPERESHIRPLLKLLGDPDQQVECFRAAHDAAKSANRALKASDVAKAVGAVLVSKTPGSPTPVNPTTAEIITRITRTLLRGLERHTIDVLNHFEIDLVQFKTDWFERNAGLASPAISGVADEECADGNTGDENEREVTDTPDAAAPVLQEVVSVRSGAQEQTAQAGPGGHPASVSPAKPGNTSGLKTVDRVLKPGRQRYDAIGLELASGVTLADLRALNLHRHMENHCLVFLKFSGDVHTPAGFRRVAGQTDTGQHPEVRFPAFTRTSIVEVRAALFHGGFVSG